MDNKKGGKPQTQAMKAMHTLTCMTEVQARRRAAGKWESKPSDYRAPNGLSAQRDARRAIEDRKMLKELEW